MTLGHWHGYLWAGSSKDLKDESLRRPGAPGTPATQEFLRSSLPPMRLGHYLLRRNAVLADLTWTDVDEAIDWMAATYKSHPPMEGDVGFPAVNGASPLAGDVGLDARSPRPARRQSPAGHRQCETAQHLPRHRLRPADEINVVKDGAARHPRAYATAGKLDPARMAMWRERGYSFQIRNLDRWYPPLHAMCRAIQQETGFGCYVTAFVTPAGAQGLDYHWDQNIGIIYQAAGFKTWQIWRPVVEEPHRGYKASNTQPLAELVEQLKADGPDLEIELKPAQVLVLPRGWFHNPHALNQTEDSVHLTFVIRERTGYWIGERLAKAAIESTPLRRVIAPADTVSETALAAQIDQARSNLVDWLSKVDTQAFAAELLDTARSELEPDYI